MNNNSPNSRFIWSSFLYFIIFNVMFGIFILDLSREEILDIKQTFSWCVLFEIILIIFLVVDYIRFKSIK